ncbi:MAG: class I SAM-dependent methyltransferase [Paludibacter sp.]|nr:class I SAM-dependent methyltransferase [Paludibacter sp.]
MGYNWDYLDKNAYNNKVGRYKFKREYDFIFENGKNHFGKVLDVAGGAGRFAIPLSKYTKQITVLDANETALQLLNQRKPEIETILGDFMKMDFQHKFSFILCIEALGYFQNWEEFFLKINQLMQEDARFVFSYQNPQSWRFFLRKLKHWKAGFYEYKEMNLEQLKVLLNQCNLEIVKMDGMNWMPFSLASNSILVPVFEKIERILLLNKFYNQSPWILFSLKRRN